MDKPSNILDYLIQFCLKQKLVVVLVVLMTIAWGLMVAPFDWDLGGVPRDPVPVGTRRRMMCGFLMPQMAKEGLLTK